MIERYALSPLKELWELKAQYERWLEVELAVVKAYEETGLAPAGMAEKIRSKARIDVEGIAEIEKVVDHDVIAFIKYVTGDMGDEARYFHLGLTSSDIVDTALSLALRKSGLAIIQALTELSQALAERALIYKDTVCMGRTHGIHAEPTSFGLKFLSFMVETDRNIERLRRSVEASSVGKLSGAVGNYANIPPEVEAIALREIGLRPTEVSTQIVPRDIHAEFISAMAIAASSIERMAVEFRHLQRTEVLEVQEPFKKGQRGSSAMPHKKNPIICERLTGMARLLRGYAGAALEDIALWHERDISHSSVERIMLPDATMLLYYMAKKSIDLAKDLVVYPERMLENFKASRNLVFSQRVMLTLVEKGMAREEAYKLVQELSLNCWNEGRDFKEAVAKSREIEKYIDSREIDELFDPEYYLRNVDPIFKRILDGG
ncbi:MAG TPA: adenylosuccinate lyase [Mesotoga sp.]|jgi:adenylosuccinate lyase|nr:adenylosuccinate lyase [Mesotoga sp.]MDI9375483.1 adenylosuccinate lyase [Thermotogota bacterium]MDD4478901.1 adenylosuccinate lyase [Mesotoga sp.]MDD5743243.1 adenylosuccinate lyase [Mesotoga sp.]HOI62831.1 adenylosuccinate lyase [Mesotoga sp.]